MEGMENPVIEEVTENAEPTAEESPKLYTQADLDKVREEAKKGIGMRLDRRERQVRREYENKYGSLMETLRADTGEEDVEQITEALRSRNGDKGVPLRRAPAYSEEDLAVLAGADADEIIGYGMDEVTAELDRLTDKGVDKMTAREKATFRKLEAWRQVEVRKSELAEIGISEDVLDREEFKSFAARYKEEVPLKEVYAEYAAKNKKSVEQIGSMKNGGQAEEKHFYTPEEVDRLTPADFKNPQVMRDVRWSMSQWK